MKKLIIFVSTLISALFSTAALAYTVQSGDYLAKISQKFGMTWQELWALNPEIKDPNIIYPGQELVTGEQTLGGTLPVAGQTYYLAGSGITASATSITLQSLTIPQSGYELQDSDFSSTFYITLEPGNTKKQEIASCTTVVQNANNTATLSGCTRGLLPFTPYTASTTYAFAHGGGTIVIFSDAPQLFNEYPAKSNNETITSGWVYTVFPQIATSTALPSNNADLASKYYVDSVGAGGFTSLNVSTTRGLSVDGSSPEKVGVNVSATSGLKFILPNGYLTVSTTATSGINVSPDGVSIDTTDSLSWYNPQTFNNTTTMATTTMTSTTVSRNLTVLATSTLATTTINGTSTQPLIDGSVTELHSHYSPNTDVASAYHTTIIPINAASTTGWTVVNYLSLASNAGVEGFTFPGTGIIATKLPGSSTTTLNFSDNKIVRLKFRAIISDDSSIRGFGLVTSNADVYSAITGTNNTIRFVVSATNTLYAVNANGTNTNTEISAVDTAVWNTYEIIWTPGTDVKFYVNGVLRATHTTNLPTASSPAVNFTIGASAGFMPGIYATAPTFSIQI